MSHDVPDPPSVHPRVAWKPAVAAVSAKGTGHGGVKSNVKSSKLTYHGLLVAEVVFTPKQYIPDVAGTMVYLNKE